MIKEPKHENSLIYFNHQVSKFHGPNIKFEFCNMFQIYGLASRASVSIDIVKNEFAGDVSGRLETTI